MGTALTLISIVFAIQIPSGIVAIWTIEKQEHVNRVLKWLLYCSIFLSWVYSPATIVSVSKNDNNIHSFGVYALMYFWNWSIMLTTLMWYVSMYLYFRPSSITHCASPDRRIHICFSGTAYQLSRCQYYFFGAVLVYNMLSPCVHVAFFVAAISSGANIFSWNTYTTAAAYGTIVFSLWIVLYPIMALTATCIFQRKLLALAKKQAVSSTNVTKEVELNDHQEKLIAVAAYVLSTTDHRV